MQTITISWEPADGAEPSNIFDSFGGRVFGFVVGPAFERIQVVWDRMVDSDDGPIIRGWEHDPETGDYLDRVSIPLSDVRSIQYL